MGGTPAPRSGVPGRPRGLPSRWTPHPLTGEQRTQSSHAEAEEPEVGVASLAPRDPWREAGSRHLEPGLHHGPRHLGSLYGREGPSCCCCWDQNSASVVCILGVTAQGKSYPLDCFHDFPAAVSGSLKCIFYLSGVTSTLPPSVFSLIIVTFFTA